MSASLTDPANEAVPAEQIAAPEQIVEAPPLTFPLTVSVDTQSITLHANGVAEADVKGFEAALTVSRGIQPATALLLWLVLKSIKGS